jgi:hypothetical protein
MAKVHYWCDFGRKIDWDGKYDRVDPETFYEEYTSPTEARQDRDARIEAARAQFDLGSLKKIHEKLERVQLSFPAQIQWNLLLEILLASPFRLH